MFERTTRRYGKPAFGLPRTTVDGKTSPSAKRSSGSRPFCNLIHFKRDIDPAVAAKQPKVLLVAPMSGHYATLLRGTVEAFLPDHDVYITDWIDARDVPPAPARFDLDDYIDYMIDMFRHFKGDVHVFAVCQPSVPVLAAIARMEADGDPNVPHSHDAGRRPGRHAHVADRRQPAGRRQGHSTGSGATSSTPCRGRTRASAARVYPGFLQLTGFMTMNLDRHVKAHKDLYFHLVDGDGDSVEKHDEFYDEYLAVMDLTAEFYLQTIDKVFVEPSPAARANSSIAASRSIWRRSRRVALMTSKARTTTSPAPASAAPRIDLCRAFRPRTSSTSSARRSATTASSTARASAPRSRRACATSCAASIRARRL